MQKKNKIEHYQIKGIVCGCDEAGRGALAGPVVAAAVILPSFFYNSSINDSKKMTKKSRNEISKLIKTKSIAWGVGIVDNKKIDKINILNASIQAMHIAIDVVLKKMKDQQPDILLIDGNKFKSYKDIKHKCIIKGDEKFMSIAAASIIAKKYRDDLMNNLDTENPEYSWKKNKGYPTKEHRDAIIKHGVNKYHRKSF